jgi:hypothetical protein
MSSTISLLGGIMSMPDPVDDPNGGPPPPLTFGGWSFFDKVRFRWGGAGDVVLGVALIGGGHSAAATVFGVLFIALGVATWTLTGFGGGKWYSAWNKMRTPKRVVAGVGSVIGVLFIYLIFFWFFILRFVWKYIIAPSL